MALYCKSSRLQFLSLDADCRTNCDTSIGLADFGGIMVSEAALRSAENPYVKKSSLGTWLKILDHFLVEGLYTRRAKLRGKTVVKRHRMTL
ncbi:hypothetical protein PoB_006050900 [Plakobranchus ocellatus]|uniref:Uncharacterized protein n=1 Tax=Plakobranchus ocellatus TaxID=259542 RepID=A0AAV4CQ62_9GAST|nr:hypothetical protein PoB_006050900 [Plakobranchus ocellatus]